MDNKAKLQQKLGNSTSQFANAFRFAGGYVPKGQSQELPVDYTSVIVDTKSLFKFVSPKGFAIMDTRTLIQLADDLGKIVDHLAKQVK